MKNQKDIELEKAIAQIKECLISQSEMLQCLSNCSGWGMILSESEYAWLLHIASAAVKRAREL